MQIVLCWLGGEDAIECYGVKGLAALKNTFFIDRWFIWRAGGAN